MRFLFGVAVLFVFGCTQNTEQPNNHHLTILFGGDVMFDRGVRTVAQQHGYDWLLQDLAQLAVEADAFVVNLETPIAHDATHVLKQFVFNSDTACLTAMKRAGITHLNLANNHSVDYGKPGLEATFTNISKRGLKYTGAALGIEPACEPVIIKKGNLHVALFSSVLLPLERWYNTAGSPCVCTESATELATRIRDWLNQFPTHIPVIQLHWGAEYRFHPELHQLKDAQLLVEAGAKLIVGHHPHVIQEMRFIDGVPVVFSLGNLVFDNPRAETRMTGVLRCEFYPDQNLRLALYPMLINSAKPTKIDASDYTAFLAELAKHTEVTFKRSGDWLLVD